ncbi:AsnC family protein [Thermoanaerobacterium sp. RBIITD]|uniref:AsnC family protein n=1 Tax=Thermoanaerobacterium sp. RBIITD TaxID=1550240 RepID=UPI000BB80973|nr:AsnC family protein [Thermoanaerobacterium sp. RBIITD]SNX53666.1 hypothetical protein SAMN05660242_1226 [Thermoanaerobacterium sp. RBIITD]
MNSETVIKRGCAELTILYGESLLININPNKRTFDKVLCNEELTKRQKENSFLISMLDNLFNKNFKYNLLLKKGYFFILCDRNGYIIKLIYNDQLKDYFNKLDFTEGNSLRLEDCGTNAISVAMEYNSQAELYGKDHYCDLFKDWYCTAVPIVDYYYEKIIAYLDMSRINIPNIKQQSIILKNIVSYIEESISHRSEVLRAIGSKLDNTDKLILSSLARNNERKLIIPEINISERTLKRHLNKLNILFKASNDLGIVINAIKAGIIDLDGNILL